MYMYMYMYMYNMYRLLSYMYVPVMAEAPSLNGVESAPLEVHVAPIDTVDKDGGSIVYGSTDKENRRSVHYIMENKGRG